MTHTTPEVEEIVNEWKNICADVVSGKLSPLYADDWLRTTLETQQKKWEEEVEKAVEIIKQHHEETVSAVDAKTDYCRGMAMGLRFSLQALTTPKDE